MTIEIIFTIVFGKCDELIFQHRTKDEKQLNAECDWISLWNVINCFDVLVSPLLAPTTNNNACSSARYHEILDSWKIFDIVLPLNGWNDANDIQFTIIFFDVLQNLHRYLLATWMEATSKRLYIHFQQLNKRDRNFNDSSVGTWKNASIVHQKDLYRLIFNGNKFQQ